MINEHNSLSTIDTRFNNEENFDSDPRILEFIDAIDRDDRDTVELLISKAILDRDPHIIRRFVTINICARRERDNAIECLRIAQLEARAWKNIAQGCRMGGTTKKSKRKIDRGERQLIEVEDARQRLGGNWIEYTTLGNNDD